MINFFHIFKLPNFHLNKHNNNIAEYFEPCVPGTIITPKEYIWNSLCTERSSGIRQATTDIAIKWNCYRFSWSLEINNFGLCKLRLRRQGLVKLCFHLNQQPIDEFNRIVHISKVNAIAREMVVRLKELIPKQMVQVAIQTVVGSKVLARETIKAYRKVWMCVRLSGLHIKNT